MMLTVDEVHRLLSAAATPAAAMAAAEALPDTSRAAQVVLGGAIALTLEQRSHDSSLRSSREKLARDPTLQAVREKLALSDMRLLDALAHGKHETVRTAARQMADMTAQQRRRAIIQAREALNRAL